MNRVEVIDLLMEIKEEYPFFDVSDENIERHFRYLKDFPFEAAMRNVEQYIKTDSKKHPGIADIRGRLGDQLDSQRSKEETANYFAQLEASRLCNSPPPTGYWEHMRTLIRGESVE
ncbi:replicative helicase loader/inhibitor [Cohnella herbarum]|uniref:Replicative helicase inhibitor G39P N-terminal domain-containing protein n=1 Tax=Cohnella herbarum TaxID=2728023 RepID=A0A7Z2VRC5_9BACL|nr:replicative helicase loader/inhibitor [Cohnella herbarum]QJD87882.1 hypothetical protein HH215_34950 [Cohnella herbarum]